MNEVPLVIEGLPIATEDKSLLAGLNPNRYMIGYVHLRLINILEQPRKTFTGIEEMADNIARYGLLLPMVVLRYDEDHCQELLNANSKYWEVDEVPIDLLVSYPQAGEKIYYILDDGERRTRALWHLVNPGCKYCNDAYGPQEPWECLYRHFPHGLIPVSLRFNTPIREALAIQQGANRHEEVPHNEQARSWQKQYRFLKAEMDPNLTIPTFAREVGVSPARMRDAIGFCELPEEVQRAYDEGAIRNWGIVTQFVRLHRAGVPEGTIVHYWLPEAVGKNFSSERMEEIVSSHLKQRKEDASNVSLFELTEPTAVARRPIYFETHLGLRGILSYARRIRVAFDLGIFSAADSPYTTASCLDLLADAVEEIGKQVPHLKGLGVRLKRRGLGNVVEDVSETVQDILATLEKEARVIGESKSRG